MLQKVTKKALDTETSVDNFEIPNQMNVGDKVEVSTIDSEKYSYLAI